MKKSKLFKIAPNGQKIGRNWFLDPPPKKKYFGGRTKNFGQKWKNQSCSKLPKMARKLVKNYFLIVGHLPQLQLFSATFLSQNIFLTF